MPSPPSTSRCTPPIRAWWHDALRNYGTIFLGPDATVAYSDKAIGTNHVLPTRGAARYTSGLWVGSFLRTPTYQVVDSPAAAANVARATAAISTAEGMLGHALTATVRLECHRTPTTADATGALPTKGA